VARKFQRGNAGRHPSSNRIFPTPEPHRRASVYDDAYLVALQLRDVLDHELWQDFAFPSTWKPSRRTTLAFYDLRRDPIAFVRQPYHCLQFYLPHSVLSEIAQQHGYRFEGELNCPYGIGQSDPVIRQLGAGLLPALKTWRSDRRLVPGPHAAGGGRHM